MPILQGRRAVAFAERKAALDSQHVLMPSKPTGRERPAADDQDRLLSGNT